MKTKITMLNGEQHILVGESSGLYGYNAKWYWDNDRLIRRFRSRETN